MDHLANGVQSGDAAALDRIALARRSVRHFRSDPIPPGLLEEVLAVAQRSPTGYNMQAWIAIVVTDPAVKARLRKAAFNQSQVEEAPAVVVFASDTEFISYYEKAASLGTETGHWSHDYARYLRRVVRIVFGKGPAYLGNLIRWAGLRLGSLVKPMPMVPFGRIGMEAYGFKQVAMAIQTFMLAAAARGLDTCPMEGIDSRWVAKAVGLPSNFTVPAIVPIGYAKSPAKLSPRYPPGDVFFRDQYPRPLGGVKPLIQ